MSAKSPEHLSIPDIESGLRTEFIGRRLIYEASVPSTMNLARMHALQGAPDGATILADEQTAGRGRFGRTWVSPAGRNIYLTLVLRPPLERLRLLGVISPLAISLAIEETTGLTPSIKWPNDVRVGSRKLSGVLIENEFEGSDLAHSLVGIGLNVNFDPSLEPDVAEIATSVLQETGSEQAREPLICALLNHFEKLYLGVDRPALVKSWRSRLDTLGGQVSVTFRGQVVEGVAEDVDQYGDLLVRRADGSLETVVAGEVTLRPSGQTEA